MPNKSFKEISHCKKCKGQKVKTFFQGKVVRACNKCEIPVLIKEANKAPRTGRVEKKGDREKLEKELNNLPKPKFITNNKLKKIEKIAKMIRTLEEREKRLLELIK